jgi:hypothetical protein
MPRILKTLLLITLISTSIFALDEEQYNNHDFHRTSALAAFLSDKTDEASRQKIILEFIDFFLMAEELQIQKENIETHNGKLANEYIKKYFNIKKTYYKSFFTDKNTHACILGLTPLDYFYRLTKNIFTSQSIFNICLDCADPVNDSEFYAAYGSYYTNLDISNFKNKLTLTKRQLDIKSNALLKTKINKLIERFTIGSSIYNTLSFLNYDFKGNENPYSNKLAQLLINNDTIFSFDYKSLIQDDEITLNIVHTGTKSSFNLGEVSYLRNNLTHNFHDKYIIDLLHLFIGEHAEKIDERHAEELMEEVRVKNIKKKKKKIRAAQKKKKKK